MQLKLLLFLLFINKINCQSFERQQIQSYHTCRIDTDCKINSFCYGNDDNKVGKCKCIDGFELYRNTTFYECLPAIKLGDECERDYQCIVTSGPMAYCSANSANKICECNSFSHKVGGFCHPTSRLTEPCMTDNNCLLGNNQTVFCTDGFCTCNLEQQPSQDKMSCIPIKRLGQICKTNEECANITNAVCTDVCRCNVKSITSRSGSNCLEAATSFGAPCEEDAQCSKFLTRSICGGGYCTCEAGFHNYSTTCLRTRRQGESCEEDGNCIFDKKLLDSVTCENHICKCKYGVTDDEYGCKLESNKNSALEVTKTKSKLFIIGMYLLILSCQFI